MLIELTRKSLQICCQVAADKSQALNKRQWHGRWLEEAEAEPNLRLNWWDENTTPELKQKLEAVVDLKLSIIKYRLENSQSNRPAFEAALDAAIERINERYGVGPVPYALDLFSGSTHDRPGKADRLKFIQIFQSESQLNPHDVPENEQVVGVLTLVDRLAIMTFPMVRQGEHNYYCRLADDTTIKARSESELAEKLHAALAPSGL